MLIVGIANVYLFGATSICQKLHLKRKCTLCCFSVARFNQEIRYTDLTVLCTETEEPCKPEEEIISINNASPLPLRWFQVIGFLQSSPSAPQGPSREGWAQGLILVTIILCNRLPKQIIPFWVSKIHIFIFIYKDSHRTAEMKMSLRIPMGRFLLCVQETKACLLPEDRSTNKCTDKNPSVERSVRSPLEPWYVI